jgi:hypothetical protein
MDRVIAAEREESTTAVPMVKVMTGRWEKAETISLTGVVAASLAPTGGPVVQAMM